MRDKNGKHRLVAHCLLSLKCFHIHTQFHVVCCTYTIYTRVSSS